MSFLSFFGYYILSFILLQSILIGIYLIRDIRQKKKFNKFLKGLEKEGKFQFITLDEAKELFDQKEKKTWN